ncbi:MAG: hypothetical protein ABL994_00475, partial [Verrucomicrobiales bacterium]
REDVKWTAIYDPKSQRATLVWYPQPLPGQGLKTFYWDKTVYHKLYNHIYSNAIVAGGTKFAGEVVLRSVETGPAPWKDRIRELAGEMKAAKK